MKSGIIIIIVLAVCIFAAFVRIVAIAVRRSTAPKNEKCAIYYAVSNAYDSTEARRPRGASGKSRRTSENSYASCQTHADDQGIDLYADEEDVYDHMCHTGHLRPSTGCAPSLDQDGLPRPSHGSADLNTYADTGVDDHAVDFVPPVMAPTLLTQAMLNANLCRPQQGDVYGADKAMYIYNADYAPPGQGSGSGSGGALHDGQDDFYAVPDGVAVTGIPEDAGTDGAGRMQPARRFSSSGEIFRDPSFALQHGSSPGSRCAPPLPREPNDVHGVDAGKGPVGAMLGDAGAHVLGDEGHYVAPSEVHVPDPRATTASILTEVYGGVAPGCVDADTPAYGEVTIITDTKMMETEASFGAGKMKEGKAKKVKAAKVFDDIPPEYAANTLDQAVMTRRWTEKNTRFRGAFPAGLCDRVHGHWQANGDGAPRRAGRQQPPGGRRVRHAGRGRPRNGQDAARLTGVG